MVSACGKVEGDLHARSVLDSRKLTTVGKLVDDVIQPWETVDWQTAMLGKSTFASYQSKSVVRYEDIYDIPYYAGRDRW